MKQGCPKAHSEPGVILNAYRGPQICYSLRETLKQLQQSNFSLWRWITLQHQAASAEKLKDGLAGILTVV